MRFRGRDFCQLTRPRLSAAVAAAAFIGFRLQPFPSGDPVAPLLGVFLLAAGCSALNQVQERRTDALMERTRHRPLPAGRMAPPTAVILGAFLLVTAFLLLGRSGPVPLAGGMAALLLYNALYTPLKRRTPLALLPGSLCGALALPIGWTAAGGAIADPRIVVPAACLFLWQVPHFWLMAEGRRDDYVRAGLPVPFLSHNRRRSGQLAGVWLLCLALLAAFFFAAAPDLSPAARLGGIGCALSLLHLSFQLARGGVIPLPILLRRVNLAMAGVGLFLLLPAG